MKYHAEGKQRFLARFIGCSFKFKNIRIISLIAWLNYNVKNLKSADVAYEKMKVFETYKDANWHYDSEKVFEALIVLRKLREEAKIAIREM